MFDELSCPNCGEKALEKEGGLGYTARFANYTITQACNFALNATPLHASFPDEGNLFPVQDSGFQSECVQLSQKPVQRSWIRVYQHRVGW